MLNNDNTLYYITVDQKIYYITNRISNMT